METMMIVTEMATMQTIGGDNKTEMKTMVAMKTMVNVDNNGSNKMIDTMVAAAQTTVAKHW